jgi:hypothetical protein
MAINLSGFLGGLGEGFGSYQKEQLVKKNTQFEKDSELERQRLARLADKRGQEAIDRQARAEERLQGTAEYNQGLGIFNQIQEIARADADDDVTTGRFLRSPGLDEASRQQEVQGRLQRYNQRQTLIKTLSGQGKVTQTFGDVSTLLRPTQFGTPDFKMPKPMIDPVQLRTMTDAELQKIIKAPAAQKADVAAQARKRLEYYADPSYIDANIPAVGADMGFGGSKGAKPLENPAEFFQQNPMFQQGVGGERILPTGAKQVVKYVNGVPQVEYQRPLKADYVAPEAESLKSGILNRQLEFLTKSMDSRVAKSVAEAEKVRWSNLLSGKQYDWYDKIASAKAAKLRSNGSGASDSLRRLSIMLAHNDRVAALGQRQREFKLTETKAWNDTVTEFDKNLSGLKAERDAMLGKVGSAQDAGAGATRAAAQQGVARLDKEIQRLESLGAKVKTQNLGAASEVIGTNFTPAAELDATTMYADQQTQQQQALLTAQMGMAGPRYQQQPTPQAPAQAPMVFAPNINLGGMAGGAGMPGAAGGGALGGPGVMGGAGAGSSGVQFDPLTGEVVRTDPKTGKPIKPTATYDQTLVGLKGKYPKLSEADLARGARALMVAPDSRDAIFANLKGKSDAIQDKPKPKPVVTPANTKSTAAPAASVAKLDVPPNYRGWTKDGKPYTGPEFDGYGLSRSDVVSMTRAGKSLAPYKLRWINQTPAPPIVGDPFVDAPSNNRR